MISGKLIGRNIFSSGALWNAPNKSLLAKLRKKTGYAFSNCKKALELHPNDIDKAELWLKEQAQSLGWAKAEKVQNRATTQGLIATICNNNRAALVEINCETDFVARNQKFFSLSETVTNTVFNHANSFPVQDAIIRKTLDGEYLKNLVAQDGKLLSNHAALTIGEVGENIGLRRAVCFGVAPDVKLVSCTHPAPIDPTLPVSVGRYGVLLAYRSPEDNEQLGLRLCQHIIGMNPSKVGDANMDKPNPEKDDEKIFIFQEFLLDQNITVQQLLSDTDTEIIDFARYEIGEPEEEQKMEELETGG